MTGVERVVFQHQLMVDNFSYQWQRDFLCFLHYFLVQEQRVLLHVLFIDLHVDFLAHFKLFHLSDDLLGALLHEFKSVRLRFVVG